MNPNPTAPEPQIRLLDLAEYALVVSVDLAGHMQVSSRTPCPTERAALLRDLADRIEHTGHACCGVHPAEPVNKFAPILEQPEQQQDGDDTPPAPLWTDGAGAVWDLGLGWTDRSGTEWWWAGTYDFTGTPMMRSARSLATYPLDTLAVLAGPLSPTGGTSW